MVSWIQLTAGCCRVYALSPNLMPIGALASVRYSGYRNVATIECRGSTYTFESTRKGRDVIVYVDSGNGAIWRR